MSAGLKGGQRPMLRPSRRKLHLRRCPACKLVLHIQPVMIDSEAGCRCWSDGVMDGDMFPALRQYGVCPSCQHAFAFGEIEHVARKPAGARQIPAALVPDSDGWRSLATRFFGDGKNEKSVRLAWWHHLNDAWRTGHLRPRPLIDVSWRGAMDENLSRLLELLHPADPDERILIAEVLRELGQFDRALALLAEVPESKRWMAGFVGAHAASGSEELFGLERVDGAWLPVPPLDPQTLESRRVG